MMGRCYNPKRKKYERYGGRGIVVCAQWHDFAVFLADMGERPAGTSIERIDNDGNYEPSNCRWATHKEQMINRSNTVLIEHGGRRLTRDEWANSLGVNVNSLRYRLEAWGDSERAFTEPYKEVNGVPMMTVSCGNCRKPFEYPFSRVNAGRGKYCSRTCANRINTRKPRDHYRYKSRVANCNQVHYKRKESTDKAMVELNQERV
jgi:hypothetical protein